MYSSLYMYRTFVPRERSIKRITLIRIHRCLIGRTMRPPAGPFERNDQRSNVASEN